jgi:hypothetical protein
MADVASLVIATMDLSIVKLLRDAMRTAALTGAATAPAEGVYAQRPGDRYEPGHGASAQGYAPFNAQPTCPAPCGDLAAARPATAVDPTRIALQDLAPDRVEQRAADSATPTALPPVIQPPWRTVPWEEPMPPRKIVKVVVRPPDIVRTGRLIDFYS